MATDIVSAEVIPDTDQARPAALALQKLGFTVRHIGGSISAEGPRELWEQTFGVTLRPQRKEVSKELGTQKAFHRPESDSVSIPPELSGLVTDVAFAEPPELFGGP